MRTTLRQTTPAPVNMAGTVGGSGSGEPDMVLIGELLEDISRHPPAIHARKLLIEHYISISWLDAAKENANELRKLAPSDPDVTAFIKLLSKKNVPPPPPPAVVKKKPTPTVNVRPVQNKKQPQPPVHLSGDLDAEKQAFAKGHAKLRHRAKHLLVDLLHLQALQKRSGLETSPNTPKIQALAEGGGKNAKSSAPVSARKLAKQIHEELAPNRALTIAFNDLEDIIKRFKGVEEDVMRSHLIKRARAVEAALPEGSINSDIPEFAFMHIEHEHLNRNYVNSETMLGDAISDIPRGNFLVTEDNYAWDLEELVQAIKANGGVMRNPLSRHMFTPKDIRDILKTTHGGALAALQVQQHEMSKGVRDATIVHMEKLAAVLLEDQSTDTLPSRHAVDEFLAYCATREYHPSSLLKS